MSSAGYLELVRHEGSERRWSSRGLTLLLTVVVAGAVAACTGGDSPAGNGTPPIGSLSSTHTSSGLSTGRTIDEKFVVAADGRQLALACWGEGSPTVLLETGGTNIEEWAGSGVVTQLSGRTRVCTYDRAGTGASDPAPNKRRDADDAVSDAHAVLQAAHITGPLVLVGRSFGGMIVTHYADVMPQDVVGVVVLDTPPPSAEFTEESEPELVWDNPENTQHLDVVHGFENRFAKAPPHIDVPLLLITPVPGEGSAEDESFWLQVSPQARQVTLSCGQEPTEGPCAIAVADFVDSLDTSK
jgi:alpha/beta hydrolase fold